MKPKVFRLLGGLWASVCGANLAVHATWQEAFTYASIYATDIDTDPERDITEERSYWMETTE